MNVLYEDSDIILCEKPAGVLSQNAETGENMPRLLQKYFEENGEKASAFCVHRLDREVGGVMVFAKNQKSAAALSSLVSNGEMHKYYLAAAQGKPQEDAGELRDLLFKDSRRNKSFVVERMRKGVKEAVLRYRLLDYNEENDLSLLRIELLTGRTHQIRVQFSSRKMPLLGDRKYGGRDGKCGIALWSNRLKFSLNQKAFDFECPPPTESPWNLFEF